MAIWEYRVAYVDFRGRVSIEGQEILIERGERRSAFVRTVLNTIGKDGWELSGVHPLWPAETSYMIFKRLATGDASSGDESAPNASESGDQGENSPSESGEPTRKVGDQPAEMV